MEVVVDDEGRRCGRDLAGKLQWPENDNPSPATIPATTGVVRGTDIFVSARGRDLSGRPHRRELTGAGKQLER